MTVATNFGRWALAELFYRGRANLMLWGALMGALVSVSIAVISNHASPVVAALVVVGTAVACLMMLSPTFAVLLLTFSIPFERIGRLTNDSDAVAISASRILGVIALGSLLLHVLLRKQKLHFGKPFFLYAAYTAVALLSNAWAWAPSETFRDCFRVLGNLLFFFLIVNVLRGYPLARKAAIVWLAATITAGVYSLADYYYFNPTPVSEGKVDATSNRFHAVSEDAAEIRTIGEAVQRLYGTTGHPTLFGLNMTMAVPFFIWILRVQKSWVARIIWSAGLLIAAICLFLSNTRAVVLLVGFTILFALFRGLIRLTAQTAVGLLLVGVIVAAIIPQDVYMRSLDPSLYTSSNGDSIRVRFKFWEKSWELVQQTWTHGIGLGNQTTLVKMVTDEDTGYLTTAGARASAHNEYIWVMVEVGLVGYIFHWWFVGSATLAAFRAGALFKRQGQREQQLFAIACQVLMVGILLFALQSEAFHYPLKSWWLVAALSCNLLDVARQHERENPSRRVIEPIAYGT